MVSVFILAAYKPVQNFRDIPHVFSPKICDRVLVPVLLVFVNP